MATKPPLPTSPFLLPAVRASYDRRLDVVAHLALAPALVALVADPCPQAVARARDVQAVPPRELRRGRRRRRRGRGGGRKRQVRRVRGVGCWQRAMATCEYNEEDGDVEIYIWTSPAAALEEELAAGGRRHRSGCERGARWCRANPPLSTHTLLLKRRRTVLHKRRVKATFYVTCFVFRRGPLFSAGAVKRKS